MKIRRLTPTFELMISLRIFIGTLGNGFYTTHLNLEMKISLAMKKGLFRCASGFLETYRVQETKCDGTIDLYNGTDMLEENKDRMYSMTHPNGSTYETCINWNQYYTECRAGPENPFKGAISFDNIGYAWIAIFQDCF